MGKHEKKDNSEKLKQIACEMLQGVASGVISGIIVYFLTK